MYIENAVNPPYQNAVNPPYHTAPESFVAGPAARDYLVDVWALGCLLYILLGGYSPYAENDPKMTVNRVINGRYYPFSTDAVWESVSDEAKDVIAQCFKVERGERITVQGLREHPWLSMEQMGLRHADLTHTRSKLQKNFKGKFKKAGNTIRAALRLQRLMKPMAVSTAAHDPRSKTDSDDGDGGTRDGDGDRGGVVNEEPSSASAASGDAGFDVVNSIEEGEEEREEKEEGGESTRERRGSAEKHASSTTKETLVPEE